MPSPRSTSTLWERYTPTTYSRKRTVAHHTPIFIQGIVEWIEYDRKTASEWHRFATIDSIRQFEVYWAKLEPQVRLIKANTYHSFEVHYHQAHVQKDIHRSFAKGPSEVMDAAEYGRVRPDLCKVGYATGTTCGNSTDGPALYGAEHAYFKAPSFEGDSGSPVFAQTRTGEIVAVGVLSGEMVGGIEYRSAQTLSKDLLRNLGVEVQATGA